MVVPISSLIISILATVGAHSFDSSLPPGCNIQSGRKCRLADGSLHPAAAAEAAEKKKARRPAARNFEEEVGTSGSPKSLLLGRGPQRSGGLEKFGSKLDRCLGLVTRAIPHDLLYRPLVNATQINYMMPVSADGTRVFNAARICHIPKTAGYSLRAEISKRFNLSTGHMEEYLSEFITRWPESPIFTMLRHPRAHVYSQYLECRYDDWGRETTANTSFPRNGSNEAGFNLWLDHFISPNASIYGESSAFRCYNPWNMQSRYLVRRRPPFMSGDKKYSFLNYLPAHFAYSAEDKEPPAKKAVEELLGVTWFGITELFHESMCLLEYQVTDTLPVSCSCGSKTDTAAQEAEAHETHHVPAHSVTALSVSSRKKIDFLTMADSSLYSHALAIFIHRIELVEAASGTNILCQERKASLSREVGYIPAAAAALNCTNHKHNTKEG